MKDNSTLLTLCAGEPAADPAMVKALRDGANSIVTALNSMLDFLDEPLKAKFIEVKNQINTMLAGLPETDKVPAALSSNSILQQLLSVMSTAQFMITGLSETARGAKEEASTMKASLSGEIDKAIEGKITAGELIKKADAETRITEAVTKARSDFEADQKTISTRRLALASASLPTPSDDHLKGGEEEYNPRLATVKARAEALKELKVPADKLTTLCWDAEASAFELAVALAKENRPTQGPNGFITRSGSVPAAKPIGMI